MSEAEEQFMVAKTKLESALRDFFAAGENIGIGTDDCMSDVNDAIIEATGGLHFEDYVG